MMAFKLVLTGLLWIYHYRRALFKALWLPILISLAIRLVAELSDSELISSLSIIPTTLIYAICAISIHRILILGEEYAPAWREQGWTKRESVFVVTIVVLFTCISAVIVTGWLYASLLIVIPAIDTYVLAAIVAAIAALAIAMLFPITRLLLILPMIALDKEPHITDAWRLGAKYPFSIPFSIMLASVIVMLPSFLTAPLPGSQYVVIAINEVLFVVDVAVLSAGLKLVMQET